MKKEQNPERPLDLQDVREALEVARNQGSPEFSTAADEALQGNLSEKTGYSAHLGKLSRLEWSEGVGEGTLVWEGGSWDVYDYGDKLPPTGTWSQGRIGANTHPDEPESRQCLLLHCAAGYLHSKNQRVPSRDAVIKATNAIREELVSQATVVSQHLGDCPDWMPRSEADLRVFVHDLLHWSHDKDYRTLAAFPPDVLLDRDLVVVRMAGDGDLSTEMIKGVLSMGRPQDQIHVLVHQGHMRLLIPTSNLRQPPLIREVLAAGWECHLEAASGSEAAVRARDYLVCPRCQEPEDVPRRSGLRPPSVLGLHLDASIDVERIGAWEAGKLEMRDYPLDHPWSLAEIAEWLGPKPRSFRELSDGAPWISWRYTQERQELPRACLPREGLPCHLVWIMGKTFVLHGIDLWPGPSFGP